MALQAKYTLVPAAFATLLIVCAHRTVCARSTVTEQPPLAAEPVEEGVRGTDNGSTTRTARIVRSVVWVSHDPIYSVEAETVTLTGNIENHEGLLSDFHIEWYSGPINYCNSAAPHTSGSAKPCPPDEWEHLKYTCEITSATDKVVCEHSFDVDAGELVTYRAVATVNPVTGLNGNGRSSEDVQNITTPWLSFAYGIPDAGTARPVWWHADSTLTINRLQLAFYPDADYGTNADDYGEFSDDVVRLIVETFFETGQSEKIAAMFTDNRQFFDLWVAPFGADADKGCINWEFSDSVAPVRKALPGGAIIHRKQFHDCADVEPPGIGTVEFQPIVEDGSEYFNKVRRTLVHEAGHFLFGLGDEWGASKVRVCSKPPNIYIDKDSCLAAEGLPRGGDTKCMPMENSGWYRIDDGADEVMDGDDPVGSDFVRSSEDAIEALFKSCVEGQCYADGEPECIDNTEN